MRTIMLLKPHEHAGKKYDPGARLEVDDADAKFLIDNKIGKIITPGQAQPAATKEKAADDKSKTEQVKS